jgi:hypothetical protein
MSKLTTYRDNFPNACLSRSESGVLEVALHTDGGTLVLTGIPTSNSSTSFTRSAPIPTIAW